jgi:hypothetical protein
MLTQRFRVVQENLAGMIPLSPRLLQGSRYFSGDCAQEEVGQQRPQDNATEIPLEVSSGVMDTPNPVTAKVNFIPQFNDFVKRRQAKNDGAPKNR